MFQPWTGSVLGLYESKMARHSASVSMGSSPFCAQLVGSQSFSTLSHVYGPVTPMGSTVVSPGTITGVG